MSATSKEPNCLHYGFSFHGSEVFCREGYEGAEALLSHLTSVGPLLEEALKLAELTRLEVHGVENELAKNLPYGDQRRLEIVRALATRPRLLLLDEPAAGMNPTEKEELKRLIGQVRTEFGTAILLVEHDMKVVMGICERLIVLDQGRVLSQGTPAEVRADPKVIAAYLGTTESSS